MEACSLAAGKLGETRKRFSSVAWRCYSAEVCSGAGAPRGGLEPISGRFCAAFAAALIALVALAGPAFAAAEPEAAVNTPPPDPAGIQQAGDRALQSAQSGSDADAQAYLAQNAAAQDALRAQLAESSAEISSVGDEIDSLQVQIEATDRLVGQEQDQLRVLARVIYEQPSSPLLILTSSRNAGEAMTRFSDLLNTAFRAARTKRALQLDASLASAQRARLESRRAEQQQLLEQLQQAFTQLQHYAGAIQDAQLQAKAQAGLIPHADNATQARMQEIIRETWAPLGPDAVNWAERIAFCESTYNPYAVNRGSGAAGLFQFMPSTWAASPWGSQSPFDPTANSEAAAWLYQRYGARQWDCSYRV